MSPLKLATLNQQARSLYDSIATCGRNALVAIGAIGMGLTPAFALDSSRKAQMKQFASDQQALRLAVDELKTGDIKGSIAALTYAAVNGKTLARWKLGEMYATGDVVPRDDLRAYYYFNQLVQDYDEDQPDWSDLSAISDAFVDVGVYCLNGIPNTNVRPDPRRAYELFQYAATAFRNPNAQFNLARMYILGAADITKDNLTAIRWLALAARQGHAASEALLGHMLFMGDGVQHQRVRGLTWLELANSEASGPKDQWMRDLYQRDLEAANEIDRSAAAAMYEALARTTPNPIHAKSSVSSLLGPSAALLTSSLPPAQ